MKDFQQILKHRLWSKVPQMAQKTLTQTKMVTVHGYFDGIVQRSQHQTLTS